MEPKKIYNTNSKIIQVPDFMLDIISNLPEGEFQKIIGMPNDQNYLWSEDEEEKIQDVKAFNFKKIKSIKFSDPKIKLLKQSKINDYFNFNEVSEAALEAEYALAYLVYKYTKINNIIPNWIFLSSDVLKKDFFEKFITGLNISEDSYISTYRYDNKKSDLGNIWCNFGKIFLYYDGNGTYIIFPGEQKNLLNKENELNILLGIIKSYKRPIVNKNKIYVVYRNAHGFEKKDFSLKKIKNINLDDNYNEGFPEVSKDIILKLNNKKKTGLVILHGEPGTGKTTYIRYLASKLKRDIIFIPPDMVQNITDPDFIPFLMDNSNSILIIEDAESAIQKRSSDGRTGAVSNILNLTDGLLSDCINISIVATFNTSTKNIDEALLRKGRLLKAYKFDKLSVNKSKILMAKQGHSLEDINNPMSLAEIYYFEDVVKGNEAAFAEHKNIGFNFTKEPYS